ncbi:MAG: hypothetical protein FJ026_02640 [Chloroflexi bacterium]|nr:hypothetical protein [Chloroflexota bacterium]
MSAVAALYARSVRLSDSLSAVSLPMNWEPRLRSETGLDDSVPATGWHSRLSILSSESIADFELCARRLIFEFARWAEQGSLAPAELGVEQEVVVSLAPLQVKEVTIEPYFAGPAKPQIFFDGVDVQEE